VEFEVYVSKMNGEERIQLVGSIEGRDVVQATIWLLKMMGEAVGQQPWPVGGGALAARTQSAGG
jgi:hypothetical protein